jgi:hypothetical protein
MYVMSESDNHYYLNYFHFDRGQPNLVPRLFPLRASRKKEPGYEVVDSLGIYLFILL